MQNLAGWACLPLILNYGEKKMFSIDRFEMLRAIIFLGAVISKSSEECVFVRVTETELIFTSGDNSVNKKFSTVCDTTGKTLEKFMIPAAALYSFKEMMEGHKKNCKKLAKTDQKYLFVEISEKELSSYVDEVLYKQPQCEFKDLESCFQIQDEPALTLPVISSDFTSAMKGFDKSEPIKMTLTGVMGPIHFQQENYESIVIPYIEPEDPEGKQLSLEDQQ